MERSRTNENSQPSGLSGLNRIQTDVRNKSDDINFGWFTVPATSEVSARPDGNVQKSKPDGTFPANSYDVDQLSQGEPDMFTRPACKTPESFQSATQGDGDRLDGGASPEAASRTDQETQPGPDDIPKMTVKYSEDFVVNWPLSSVGLEQYRRTSVSDQEPQKLRSQSTRSWADDSAIRIPPTPLPPLHWHGYRGSSRPTYKTWRNEWHKSRGNRDGNNNNATVGGDLDESDCCAYDENDLTSGAKPELPIDSCHQIPEVSNSNALLHGADKSSATVSFQRHGKAVYMSIPQSMKKTAFLDSAKSRIHSFPFLKWSCWKRDKGCNVKLLKYNKLSDEDFGEDNDFFNNY